MSNKSKPRAAVSWSGGKDCCLALHRARESYDIVGLVAMLTEDGSRTRSHGLRPAILRAQAEALGLPLLTANASWTNYEQTFVTLLESARRWNISHAVFGDVFPDTHRQWAEKVCHAAGLTAVEPLWGEPTATLAAEFIARGGRAMIVTVNAASLGREWLGRTLTLKSLDRLRALGVDPGGENGEFHTVVTGFPGFAHDISLRAQATLEHDGCYLLELEPVRRETSA